MESLVHDWKDDLDFENALKMIPLSEKGNIVMAESLAALTEDFLQGYGYDNDKNIWLYSLPFIHFFGGKQTAEWMPNNLRNRQFQNISAEKMIHLLKIDQQFSFTFIHKMEYQFLARKILDKSNDFVFKIEPLMLLEKMMTGTSFFPISRNYSSYFLVHNFNYLDKPGSGVNQGWIKF